jgi:hypothetical protein
LLNLLLNTCKHWVKVQSLPVIPTNGLVRFLCAGQQLRGFNTCKHWVKVQSCTSFLYIVALLNCKPLSYSGAVFCYLSFDQKPFQVQLLSMFLQHLQLHGQLCSKKLVQMLSQLKPTQLNLVHSCSLCSTVAEM